jgi:hypothetical protein
LETGMKADHIEANGIFASFPRNLSLNISHIVNELHSFDSNMSMLPIQVCSSVMYDELSILVIDLLFDCQYTFNLT